MKSTHQQRVEQFMRLAGQSVPAVPELLSQNTRLLRAKLILEECLETLDGLGVLPVLGNQPIRYEAINFTVSRDMDLAAALDGCADLSVVTIGTLSALGVDDEPMLKLVDENNLAKFGPGGHKNAAGKWIKPPDHKPPDIVAEVARQVNEKCSQRESAERPNYMKYKTSHELARELLAGPDIRAVAIVPVFDMPGALRVLTVKVTETKIEDIDCIVISAGE